jgi:hypothetical protein
MTTMSDVESKAFPDVSDILARKAEGRREIARRSFGEKIAMIEAMRERLAPLKRAREMRRAARATQAQRDDADG